MMIIDCNFMTFRDASGTQNDVEIYELRKQTESAASTDAALAEMLGPKMLPKVLGRKAQGAEKRKAINANGHVRPSARTSGVTRRKPWPSSGGAQGAQGLQHRLPLNRGWGP